MDLRTRKRWALLILVVGMPLYVVVAVTVVNWMDRNWGRLPVLVEFAVYVVLGMLWILPFRRVFSGVGRGE
jgi:predicted membrane channel-forming protein YqfA (hemolysin III family)